MTNLEQSAQKAKKAVRIAFVLLVAGVIVLFAGNITHRTSLSGVGIGLGICAVVLMAATRSMLQRRDKE